MNKNTTAALGLALSLSMFSRHRARIKDSGKIKILGGQESSIRKVTSNPGFLSVYFAALLLMVANPHFAKASSVNILSEHLEFSADICIEGGGFSVFDCAGSGVFNSFGTASATTSVITCTICGPTESGWASIENSMSGGITTYANGATFSATGSSTGELHTDNPDGSNLFAYGPDGGNYSLYIVEFEIATPHSYTGPFGEKGVLDPGIYSEVVFEGSWAYYIPPNGSNTDTKSYTITLTNLQPAPLPPGAWLFGSGLLGLIGIAKRKAA